MEGVKVLSRWQSLADRHNAGTEANGEKWGGVSFQPSTDYEAMDLGRKEDASLHSAPNQASADTSPWGSYVWLGY